ncbi:MAG: alginate export family protein [Saprospiraceae bacterium]
MYDAALRYRYLLRIIRLFLSLNIIAVNSVFAQNQDTLKESLIIDFEIRPRAEYRKDYIQLPTDGFAPDFFVSQRNRLGITYRRKAMKLHVSLQEIHLWGKLGKLSTIGSINAYELYLEAQIAKNLSVKIGRQGLSLDNGRIFSDAPWSQQGRSHEGIRLFYNKEKLATDFTIAATRKYPNQYEAAYSPVASHRYQLLLVHHLKYKINEHYTLTTINFADVFENNNNSGQPYFGINNGARLEYRDSNFYWTLNAYYQYGKNSGLKKINAYYIQPEISATSNKTTFRLGAEIMSGEAAPNDHVSRSFGILYGVAWKFMGNMNFFTRFPADVNNRGLINPYLFVLYKAGKKLSFRADSHLFYTQYPLVNDQNEKAARYLGFENDLSLNYKPVKNVNINFGFSYLIAERSMELLKKIEDANETPVWSYLMVSFNPEILHYNKH